MAEVTRVAEYFLFLDSEAEGDGISNLKLQKLAYYAQGFYLALYNRPLFESKVEAWTHGPVVVDLYHRYKGYGSEAIPPADSADFSDLTDDEISLLDEVFDVFGQYSAWKLRNMSHEDRPWLDHEVQADEISQPEMAEYFKTKLN
ncbi:Panacea domain-containing protein [Saccharospirillum salsuginis]|uniref:Antitoxin SocA-like Panacea domain-containing protein n=1 Tax=Saccharospirillum salsuginis TaxID=418750 RepID=A0A918KBJ3_9GAMM|nr:type II toxin-antitoxin system antitoxin SocA domain-containing protein [Saccharospirillum salsuginis]GGX55472.1 hypothetical protein GCM10007392_23950 [Saccharospirillum salsuginis]